MHQEFITKEKTKTSTINIGQVSIYFEYTEMNVLFKCNFKLTVRELQLKKKPTTHKKKTNFEILLKNSHAPTIYTMGCWSFLLFGVSIAYFRVYGKPIQWRRKLSAIPSELDFEPFENGLQWHWIAARYTTDLHIHTHPKKKT